MLCKLQHHVINQPLGRLAACRNRIVQRDCENVHSIVAFFDSFVREIHIEVCPLVAFSWKSILRTRLEVYIHWCELELEQVESNLSMLLSCMQHCTCFFRSGRLYFRSFLATTKKRLSECPLRPARTTCRALTRIRSRQILSALQPRWFGETLIFRAS